VIGIVCSIAIFAMSMMYMNHCEKKARENNEHWTYPDNVDPALFEVKDRSLLPSSLKSFTPMILLLLIIVIGSRFVKSSTMLATGAMLVGALVTYVLNINKFKGQNMVKIIADGLEGGIDGIGGLASVVAFGTVVSSSAAFGEIVKWVLSLNLNTYVEAVLATMTVSAITGSSSGGLKIMYTALAPDFIASGANLEVLHRLTCISADALDTLPHSPGIFLMLAVLGLNHKSGYKHVFWTSTAIPLVVTVVLTTYCVLFL